MDPVTGVLAPVVGASLDVWKWTVVPVTVSQILTLGENPDSVTVSEVELNHIRIKAHLASGSLCVCKCVFVGLRWKPSRRRAMYGAITGVSRH